MADNQRTSVDGEPYFCTICGDPWAQLDQCEFAIPDDDAIRSRVCSLETRYQAQQRKAIYDALSVQQADVR